MPESAKPRKRRPLRKPKLPAQLTPEEAAGLRNRIAGLRAAQERLQSQEQKAAGSRAILGMVQESHDTFVETLRAKYGLPIQFVITDDDKVDAPAPPPAEEESSGG